MDILWATPHPCPSLALLAQLTGTPLLPSLNSFSCRTHHREQGTFSLSPTHGDCLLMPPSLLVTGPMPAGQARMSGKRRQSCKTRESGGQTSGRHIGGKMKRQRQAETMNPDICWP